MEFLQNLGMNLSCMPCDIDRDSHAYRVEQLIQSGFSNTGGS